MKIQSPFGINVQKFYKFTTLFSYKNYLKYLEYKQNHQL